MSAFVLAATFLVLVALCILLAPWHRRETDETRRGDACLPIYREQRAELEHDHGRIPENDFAEALDELQRRVLDDAKSGDKEEKDLGKRGRASEKSGESRFLSAVILALFAPLTALLLYANLGEPRALAPKKNEARNEARVEDAGAWIRMARFHKVSGRFMEAAEAFARALDAGEIDATALSDYAETLLALSDGLFDAKIDGLIARALAQSPSAPRALILAGASAAGRGEFQAAADFWERLLRQLDPASEEARTVREAIDEARGRSAARGEKPSPKSPGKTGKQKRAKRRR
jgi:cytochrome c-type biogenesis protein CcmH